MPSITAILAGVSSCLQCRTEEKSDENSAKNSRSANVNKVVTINNFPAQQGASTSVDPDAMTQSDYGQPSTSVANGSEPERSQRPMHTRLRKTSTVLDLKPNVTDSPLKGTPGKIKSLPQ